MTFLGYRFPELRVLEWRRRTLVRAGFDDELATSLAERPGYDLHGLLDLVKRGCRPDLAARILAPLESRIGEEVVDER